MSRLVVLGDKDILCSLAFENRLCIGREDTNDFQIMDSKISRHHCVIERRGDEMIIRDLDSSNGTYVNGRCISEITLKDKDKIVLGATEMVYEQGEVALPEMEHDFALSTDGVYRMKGMKSFFKEGITPVALRMTLERLTTLLKVGNIINTSRDSASLVNAILQQIVRIIEADRYYLFLKNERTGRLDLVTVHPGQSLENGKLPEISHTILYSVLHEGTSILSVDTPHDKRFRGAKSVIMYEINSVMCVPLRSHEKILGVIQVDSRDPARFFTKEDLNLLTAIGISAGIAIENMDLYEDLKRLFHSTVRSLVAALEANDPYTGGHSVRVADYAKKLAECLRLSTREMEQIELAAFLHDIGKIGIPNEVLNKPSPFSTSEYAFMRQHPIIGYDILSKIEGMEEIARMVRHHHERFDGTGYPDGLSGKDIPLGSRIIGITDTLDAMTTDRPYRKRLSIEDAFQEIARFSGIQFDPVIVDALQSCVEKRYIV
jgi:putative nucleotidyltransferase with HDIG domain